jgi:hypothetical protein
MKKIGVLYGEAEVFATALTDRIAAKQIAEVQVEAVRISKVTDADPAAFAVILDGLSARVPFYRLFLQRAALAGTAVIGNPFLGHGDSGYFPGLLAARLGIAVPRTALLPSWKWPPDTTAQTFRSLAYPLDWQELFTYVGFPALLKPAGDAGGHHLPGAVTRGVLCPAGRNRLPGDAFAGRNHRAVRLSGVRDLPATAHDGNGSGRGFFA